MPATAGGISFYIFLDMRRTKVSVVIPTRKRTALLSKCMEALLRQDFPKRGFEVVVVSDGYDAATKCVIDSFSGKSSVDITYCNLPRQKGPAAARNLGWKFAGGELIAFTDDDCIPDENWISALWNAYQENPSSEIAFTGKTVVPLPSKPTDYERNMAQLEKAEFCSTNCACTKKTLLKVGGFDEQFTMPWCEDSDLQFKLLEKSVPIVRVPEAVVRHPVWRAPWGISIREEKKSIYNALLYKKHPVLYRQRIRPQTPWHYYTINLFTVLFLVGSFKNAPVLMESSFWCWTVLTVWCVIRRLVHTSLSFKHIAEMVLTSVVIPVFSLFWRFYGAVKYRVFFIP